MNTNRSETFEQKLKFYMDKTKLTYVVFNTGTEHDKGKKRHTASLYIGNPDDKHSVTFYSDELERMTYADFRNELKLLLPFLFGEINEELDPNASLLLSATEIGDGHFNVSVFSQGKRLHQQYLHKNQVHDDCSLFMGCASIINGLAFKV